jgi:hypothetical protein
MLNFMKNSQVVCNLLIFLISIILSSTSPLCLSEKEEFNIQEIAIFNFVEKARAEKVRRDFGTNGMHCVGIDLKTQIIDVLQDIFSTTYELSLLLPNPYNKYKAIGGSRTLQDLLQHTSCIPFEEVFLLYGKTKEEIKRRLGKCVTFPLKIQIIFMTSLA